MEYGFHTLPLDRGPFNQNEPPSNHHLPRMKMHTVAVHLGTSAAHVPVTDLFEFKAGSTVLFPLPSISHLTSGSLIKFARHILEILRNG